MMSSVLKHSKNDFIKMHNAGKLAAEVLDYVDDFIEPNITTNYLNDLCHQFIIENVFNLQLCPKCSYL